MAIIDPNTRTRTAHSGVLRPASWFISGMNEEGAVRDMWPQSPGGNPPGVKQPTCFKSVTVCDEAAQEACKKKFGNKVRQWVRMPDGQMILQTVWVADKKKCPLNCNVKDVPVPCPPKEKPPGCTEKLNCCGLYHNDKNDPKDVGKYGCWGAASAENCAEFGKMKYYSNVSYCGK